jgi:hypothetical protein
MKMDSESDDNKEALEKDLADEDYGESAKVSDTKGLSHNTRHGFDRIDDWE